MLDGIAKPIPMLPPFAERICELIPISSPRVFTRAPPELPLLMGASVWRKSSKLPLLSPVARCLALMIPEVTVSPTPNGFPTARQTSPTRTPSELPSSNTGKPVALILSTARSLGASDPMTWAEYVRRLARSTLISCAPSITCSFVRMCPSGRTMTPEPRACSTVVGLLLLGVAPPKSWRKNGSSENGNCCGARTRLDDRIVTTAGATWSTISAYDSSGPLMLVFPDGNSREAEPVVLCRTAEDWHAANTTQAANKAQRFMPCLQQLVSRVKTRMR